MKNCRNITSIELNPDFYDEECGQVFKPKNKQIFQLIIKYCNNLYEIESDFRKLSKNTIKQFCDKFGSNLKKIKFRINPHFYRSDYRFLNSCPKLSSIKTYRLDTIFVKNKLLVNNLKSISFNYCSKDMIKTGIFIENNINTLQVFEFRGVSFDLSENDFKYLFKLLPKLIKLKSLSIDCNEVTEALLVNTLRELSINCKQLKKLRLEIDNSIKKFSQRILNSINSLNNLKILDLNLRISLTSETVIKSKTLTHLSFTDIFTERKSEISLINDSFFESIDKYLPELQYIYIYCMNSYLTENTFNSLSKLSKLQTIKLFGNNFKEINQLMINRLREKGPKIKVIEVKNCIEYQLSFM